MLEFLTSLKEYKNCEKNTPKEKEVLQSLFKLIKQNIQEYENYKASGENFEILKEIEIKLEALEQEQNSVEEYVNIQSNPQMIQTFYNSWLEEFKLNGNSISPKCSTIIENLIYTYYETKFEILTTTIDTKVQGDFELFKNHLKNKLRAIISTKIEDYIHSETYQKLNFLKKIWKDKKINESLNNVSKYKFTKKEIEGILK